MVDGERPEPGQVVRVRTRHWLVETVSEDRGLGTCVGLVCLDDDAQGQPLRVVWELERDGQIFRDELWRRLGSGGFDPRAAFAAYLHTLRWNCVTATSPERFQAPFRAGIRLDPYQLEPLRKALALPRVNLFIADDVGLGKTIEAGLIASELLLRKRIDRLVVACPPSMLAQWQEEMAQRFGLTFQILDRDYFRDMRRRHGFGVNPWETFPRFLISHRLLIDERYTGPLRASLGELRPGSLFILDEAHNAAPASGQRFAIDSKLTRAVRDLCPRFEHRLFLSATPHNGHSNSFSALLELLDGDRFMRGVPVEPGHRDEVMVRRLKEDIRVLEGGFPRRRIGQVDLDQLPADAPELRLAQLLYDYRQLREQRLQGASRALQTNHAMLITGLQQRLFSSIEAFARTLARHRATMQKFWAGELAAEASAAPTAADRALLSGAYGPDDEWTERLQPDVDWSDEAAPDGDAGATPAPDPAEPDEAADGLAGLEAAAVARATRATAGGTPAEQAAERALLEAMAALAEEHRDGPDARVRWLLGWLRREFCPNLGQPDAVWADERLLIFTEYEDTRRWLVAQLRQALGGDEARRVDFYSGTTSPQRRLELQRAFNAPPAAEPLRILVATDAAREGLNLQSHCSRLIHFDVPWNPARLEQRNGRIDRKLQPRPEVFCHYFVYTQRPEDRILATLVNKTETILKELGSLSQVIGESLAATLEREGLLRGAAGDAQARRLAQGEPSQAARLATVQDELESVRTADRPSDGEAAAPDDPGLTPAQRAMRRENRRLQNLLQASRQGMGYDTAALRAALDCALGLLGQAPLVPLTTPPGEPPRYRLPAHAPGTDDAPGLETRPDWAETLQTLRPPAVETPRSRRGWRPAPPAPLRPLVFEAPPGLDDGVVQMHLSHRLVQRLLARFIAQGFVHHDLTRACLATSHDRFRRVVLLGRLALYGPRAARLHEELLAVTARWVEPARRDGPLEPFAEAGEATTLELLDAALRPDAPEADPAEAARFEASVEQDLAELLPRLEARRGERETVARWRLAARAAEEAGSLVTVLDRQKERILAELAKVTPAQLTIQETLTADERKQREADQRAWSRWLAGFDALRQREPERIREFYRVKVARLEPVGLVYLAPREGA